VIVCTSQSLHKAPKDVSLILADECHTHMTEGYVKKFNKFRRARLFGFTATPEGRSDGAEGFGEALFGPVIANVNYQESVAGGNIVQLHVRVHRSELGPEVSRIAVKATADRLGIWLNEDRNNLIARVTREVEEEIGDDQQLLIMVDKTEHAYALGQLLPNFAIVTGEPDAARVTAMRRRGSMTDDQEICTVKMRERYKKAFEAHELKRAIATKIWSKGVDFRDLAVLVRADGSGSPIDAGQVPGRLSRLGDKTAKDSGLLIDFLDTFSGNLQGRAQKRLAVYRKNGFRIEMR
jgi:superfamily II DNA or RNA helicase